GAEVARNSTGTKPPLSSTRRTMSRAPIGCWMPATAVGVGWGVGPDDGPLVGLGVAAAGLQAAATRRTRLAASGRGARRPQRARRRVPEAGGWSVMGRQTTTLVVRFPVTFGALWRCRWATPRSADRGALVAPLDGERILARRFWIEARSEENGSR